MTISAQDVKKLRDQTGAGMMDCKKALEENGGDFEAAVDWLRKKGIAKAAKKAGRVASEGMVWAVSEESRGAVVELNAETDFVAKNDKFTTFVKELAAQVAEEGVADVEAIKAMPATDLDPNASGTTVADKITSLIATIGENMNLRRAGVLKTEKGTVAAYNHMNGKIGVLVAIEGAQGDKVAEAARHIAMHVAAANPLFLDRTSVDNSSLEREKAIFADQARQSGKPENIIEKIVEGRVNKYYEEVCLADQAFVMDTDRKVSQVVKDADPNAKLAGFIRMALGEGVEKEESDFAAEVAAAVAG